MKSTSDRPAISVEVQQKLMFECRYRCACCCEPVALERAHIVPWSKTKDHSFENLVVLCANCHTRSHAEKWPDAHLYKFKQLPCALQRDQPPPVSAEQKVLIDLIAAAQPETMTTHQRERLIRMTAAYANVSITAISVIEVAQSSSSLIRLELPRTAAERLIAGFQAQDPRLLAFLDDFALPPDSSREESCGEGSDWLALAPLAA